MDEQEFRTQADAALQSLYKKLAAAADRYGFEPDFNAGALAIELEEPAAKFVVSPNTPVRQIWVSAHSKSFKLDWNEGKRAFVWPDKNQALDELIAAAISLHLGEPVTL
jgi:iron-sulfur cluster assembly protein CyaY